MKLIDLDFKDNIKDHFNFNNLQKLKLPNKNIEEFKHIDLNDLYQHDFNFNYERDNSIYDFEYLKNSDFYYIFISNTRYITHHSSLGTDLIYSVIKKNKSKSKNALYHLSQSFFEYQDQINIVNSLDKPLLIINLYNYENSFTPDTLNIHIKKNCKADIIEMFISENSGKCFLNINRTLKVDENAVLNYTKLEEFTSLDTSIFNFNSNHEENSNLNITSLDYNALKSLNIWDFYLNKENIILTINGIVNIKDKQQSANIANIFHAAKSISSNISIQHILNDESKAVFDVKSTIDNKAKYAKVIQKSKTVLLSDNAKINAQPRLQIYTDELEARHSATTGAINQEQLYYLKSRGIPHDVAINMIIESYELEVIDNIKNNTVKKFVKEFKGKGYVQR